MNRSALRVAVVAVLVAAAIVAVAGTVDDPSTGDGGPAGESQSEMTRTQVSTTQSTATAEETTTRRSIPTNDQECVAAAKNPLVVLGVLAAFASLLAYVYRAYGQVEMLALAMLVLVLLFFAYSALAVCPPTEDEPAPNRSGGTQNDTNRTSAGPSGASGTGGDDGRTRDLPLALVAVVAVLAVAAVGVVLVTREDAADDDPFDALAADEAEPEPEDAVDVDVLAAAAGRAADRIEDADDVDNEIYRAWVEMTEYIDVEHPESSTPGEFAAAAVDAGIDRDDVVELTDRFERVRYGHTAPTAEREARARDALRRIESQYGGEDA